MKNLYIKKNKIRNTGVEITELSFGTSSLGSMPDTYGYEVPEQRALETLDRFFQGPFLVHSVKHEFNITESTHTMELSLQKDSTASNFLKDGGHIEPKPIEAGRIFGDDDFYRGGGAGR